MSAPISPTYPLISRILSASVGAANQAGKIIRDIMSKGELGIVEKGINDLQTEADRSAQRRIVGLLSKQFPKVAIIGEETLEPSEDEEYTIDVDEASLKINVPQDLLSLKDEDIVIWVDPLDGTSEYTQGLLDHVTILIGIGARGKALGGVIHQPYYNYKVEKDLGKLGRTMWGVVGVGVHGIEKKDLPKDKLILTTTRSHSNALINSILDSLKPDDILRVGGAGHKVILVIEGKAHAYVFPSTGSKKWDTCAPEAILHAVGGKLTDIEGNDLQYHKEAEIMNSKGVLATCYESIHKDICQRIPQDVKDKV